MRVPLSYKMGAAQLQNRDALFVPPGFRLHGFSKAICKGDDLQLLFPVGLAQAISAAVQHSCPGRTGIFRQYQNFDVAQLVLNDSHISLSHTVTSRRCFVS